jgi:threonine/homoserine efflux transporter RhtA
LNTAVLLRHRNVFAAIVIAQLCDLLTFLPAIGRVGIQAEQNPIARVLYGAVGAAGPSALKLVAVAAVLLLLWRVVDRFPRFWGPPALVAFGLGLLGTWSNITFGLMR